MERRADGSLKFLLRLGAALLLVNLAACVMPKLPVSAPKSDDLHERLSYTIRKHGFEHGIMSRREMDRDTDAIYIPLALDTVKRQHASLDDMILELARILSLPRYDDLPILIELGAKDKPDREYLHARISEAMTGLSNVQVRANPETFNDITITVTHPRLQQQ